MARMWLILLALLFLKNTYGQFNEPGSLRLVNVNSSTSLGETAGRLEINLQREWGTICSVGFGQDDALLACKQLGYQTVVRYGTVGALGYPQASSSSRIWISNLACDPARDLTVYHCPRSSGFSCSHSQDIALECSSPYATAPSVARFVSKNEKTSPYLTAGRLDIFYVGRWGTTCSVGFDSTDARAICSILTGSTTVLNYGAVKSESVLGFDQGLNSVPIWVEDFDCYYSNTDRRYYCSFDGIGITDCTHSQDLAISCLADGAVRLVSGVSLSRTDPGSSTGRLEIYYNGEWGTVCDSQFDQTDANLVCQQLGYENAGNYGNVASLGYLQGQDTIWLSNVQCSSNDVFLANCSHSGFGNAVCRHSQDVAITCSSRSSNTVSINVASVAGAIVAASVFGIFVAIVVCILLCGYNGKGSNS